MMIPMPGAARLVIDRLNHNGYEAYAVGGCVRDSLLGMDAQDWDICTSALPEQTLRCFKDMRTIPTGLAHGTITILVDGQPLEVTTFRIDGAYSDCRHPDGVNFTVSLKEDLARRDFTINAMAYHPDNGLIDIFGGREDLADKKIRSVGIADLRFREDALRILRGLRFASVLGFAVEQETAAAMTRTSHLLSYVAAERKYTELTKLLCGGGAADVLNRFGSIVEPILSADVMTPKRLNALEKLEKTPVLRYAALYRGVANVENAMKRLRAPKDHCDAVALLSRSQCETVPVTLTEVRKTVFRLGTEMTEYTLQLMQAFGADVAPAVAALRQIKQEHLCCSFKDLAVSGKDLLAAGYAPGKNIGDMLQKLLTAVMDERVDNRKELLLQYAVSIKKPENQ